MGMDIEQMMQGVDTPHGRTPGAREAAAKYMIRNGLADVLEYLGLRDVPLTGDLAAKYVAARDKQLAGTEPVRKGKRGPTGRILPKSDRNRPDCLCAATGTAYSLCPVHGDPERLQLARPPHPPEPTRE